jgi:hypothetical protein
MQLSPSPFEGEITIAEFKKYKSPVLIKFLQNWFEQEVKHYILRSINSLILFGIRMNCLSSEGSLLLYQFTRKATKVTVVIIEEYHCYQLNTKCYPISFSPGWVHMQKKLIFESLAFYSILSDFWVPMKLVMLIKIFSKVLICIHLYDTFPIQSGLKQDTLS